MKQLIKNIDDFYLIVSETSYGLKLKQLLNGYEAEGFVLEALFIHYQSQEKFVIDINEQIQRVCLLIDDYKKGLKIFTLNQ
ncbi:hypothetical protein [Flammeovirga aprica]|uniref:Uncharacterized protein n=1 Tax=Flammeovirga aprica JL-4 TaxID=694437 RepID=A0A7X9RQC2_9BACT|nr:hypothetical protein [Flammeovirga aprica]NME66618.1 hypothetical protein [Flammeovirga aprica JL-4]